MIEGYLQLRRTFVGNSLPEDFFKKAVLKISESSPESFFSKAANLKA